MKSEHILLIDTEKNVLYTYKALLEEYGYHVDIATSEKEALAKLSRESFAVLITEFYLKGHDLTSFLKEVKCFHPEIYIIMTTAAYISSDIYEAILNAGVDDFFVKPFPPQRLLATIKKGIKRRSEVKKNAQSETKLRNLENLFASDPLYSGQYKIICNNLYFHRRLRYEIMRAKRYNRQFTLLLFSINSLSNLPHLENKQNFTNQLSEMLLKNTRRTDTITRYNGSYALILLEATTDGTKILTGRLQEQIAHTPTIQDTSPNQNLKFDYFSYPDHSELIDKWMIEAEKE